MLSDTDKKLQACELCPSDDPLFYMTPEINADLNFTQISFFY